MSINVSSKSKLRLLYLGGFFVSVHLALVSYTNSSLLGQFVCDSTLSILYAIGSAFGIFLLFILPFLLRKFGSVPTFLFFIALEILAVIGMGNIGVALPVLLLFIIFLSMGSILIMSIDVNLEHEIKREETTGSKRGILLTISNTAFVISPLAFTFLISQNNFGKIYFLSGLALIPLFLIILLFFKNVKKASTEDSNIILVLRSLWRGGDEARILGVQFVLYFFYAWMVIYLPLLLSREIGFSWGEIGLLFPIMLLPFVLFELPAGILSDKKMGEKEFLISGLIIMALATFLIPTLDSPVFWIWAVVLFITRIGASLVAISSESYFFKHVKEEDTGIISLFRMGRPFAYIIAPLIALPVIYFFSYSVSFYFLAFFVALGLFSIPKVDTK